MLPFRPTGRNYLLFLQQVLLQLLGDEQISALTQQTMWSQHDGAPAHYRRYADKSCIDFYFWGCMKTLVHDAPVNSAKELVARITAAARYI